MSDDLMDGIQASILALMGEVEIRGEGMISPPVACETCGTNRVWSDAPPETQVLYCPHCQET